VALDQQRVKLISDYSEVRAEKQFKKMGFKVTRLDRNQPTKRPDFLITDSSGPVLVAEVKTILSAGYLDDRGAHVSMLDPGFLDSGTFGIEVNFAGIDQAISYAVGQYQSLVSADPSLGEVPLAVVLFFDFFADHFMLYPRKMADFPNVSGLLKLEEDRLIREMAQKFTLDELRGIIESGSMRGFPPNTKEFRLLQNECARLSLPSHFVMRCVES
jgi:hypothetical protein